MVQQLVLVADSNKDICRYLEESVLRPAGYQVRTVGDGMAALTLARELKPAAVIADQHIAGLSGLELARRLRVDLPHTPVILMSAQGSESLAVEAVRAGAFDLLGKPFKAEYMLSAVGRAMAESRRWAELQRMQAEARANEQALKRRVQELEALSRIGRTVTAMLDPDQVLTTVVDAAVQLTGAEEGSLLLFDPASGELTMRASKNFDEQFARTFRLRVDDSLAGQVISSGEPVLIDEQAPQKIKTSYLVHSLIYVPLQVMGRTIGVLGVDNRKAGRALGRDDVVVMKAMADYAAIAIENSRLYDHTDAERRKLETILSQVENGVIVVDPDNRVLLLNRTAQEAFGVNGDFVGRSASEVFDDPRLLDLLRSPGKLPRREGLELEDGRVFNAQRTPIQGVGQAVVMQDISHLKELDRIKSEFVSTVSHDLRSPLTAILGYTELIERAGTLNEQQHEFVRRVQLSVEQITDLVSNLLDLGRIEAGLDVAKERTPVEVLARYAIDGLRAMAAKGGVTLETDLPDDLPMVIGSPIRLRQMIANLLENAIRYTPAGGQVRVEADAEDDQVILRVSDTGPGIPPADQPYLFDKFFRASNVPAHVPGTGLGLSIVKSIVDNHGGRIWVDSMLGAGTTFTVVLPKAED